MPDDLTQLLQMAVYKEISSQAVYQAAQSNTHDPFARALMEELASEEQKHARILEGLKLKGLVKKAWHPKPIKDLMVSDYLTGPDKLEGAGLQDTLIFAMKRELQSIQFYTQLMGVMTGETTKRLCQRLATAELNHKRKLEILYDDLVYKED